MSGSCSLGLIYSGIRVSSSNLSYYTSTPPPPTLSSNIQRMERKPDEKEGDIKMEKLTMAVAL
ncbi:hypothetical protein Hanom_Chr10g00905321 [Helianthus anomalus]